MISNVIIPILFMCKLRHREIKWFAKVHLSSKWQDQDAYPVNQAVEYALLQTILHFQLKYVMSWWFFLRGFIFSTSLPLHDHARNIHTALLRHVHLGSFSYVADKTGTTTVKLTVIYHCKFPRVKCQEWKIRHQDLSKCRTLQ